MLMKYDPCVLCFKGFGFSLIALITRIINREDCLPQQIFRLKENRLKKKKKIDLRSKKV